MIGPNQTGHIAERQQHPRVIQRWGGGVRRVVGYFYPTTRHNPMFYFGVFSCLSDHPMSDSVQSLELLVVPSSTNYGCSGSLQTSLILLRQAGGLQPVPPLAPYCSCVSCNEVHHTLDARPKSCEFHANKISERTAHTSKCGFVNLTLACFLLCFIPEWFLPLFINEIG